MADEIDLQGVRETIEALRTLGVKGANAVKQSDGEMARRLFARSQELVPVRRGDLKRSGYVQEWKNGWRVVYPLEYAQIQHDNTKYRHRKGGQALYLEGPMEEMIPEIGEAREAALIKALGD